jgi:hypothetical protein
MNILEKVSEKVSISGTKVAETVIENLAKIEIDRRVNIITQAVNRLENLEKEYKKIAGKCDTAYYDKDGNKIETMSEKRHNDIQKAKQLVEDFTKTFNKCLEENKQEDYNKLNGLLSAKTPGGGENTEK